jgi:ABC-type lipoprotein export system ATPase subunit
MPADAMIELAGVRRDFAVGSEMVGALRGVDLRVAGGEMVALLGPSGSGKTTLLGIIGGLDRPDAGSVVVGGVNLTRLTGRPLANYRLRCVGFVFQAPGLLPLMSAVENVALPLELMGQDVAAAADLAVEALEMVGMDHRARHRALELSGGEQQRVALARALVKRPQVLLADEPTGQLDSETSAAIIDLIVSIRGQTTILLATHDEIVASRADRSVFIEDGVVRLAAGC